MSRLHVVFDLDDTLYPEQQFAMAGFRSAAMWAEAEFGVSGLADEMAGLLEVGMLGKLFATVLARHVPDHTPEHLAAFREAYRHCDRPELALFDDAVHALDHYERRGPIGLITDGSVTVQTKKVRALALERRFAKIVYTDALGADRAYFKPHSRAYETMREALGDVSDRYVYVGDNPAKDFVAPNAKGWTSVLVHRDHPRIHDVTRVAIGGAPQYTVRSLRELPTFSASKCARLAFGGEGHAPVARIGISCPETIRQSCQVHRLSGLFRGPCFVFALISGVCVYPHRCKSHAAIAAMLRALVGLTGGMVVRQDRPQGFERGHDGAWPR